MAQSPLYVSPRAPHQQPTQSQPVRSGVILGGVVLAILALVPQDQLSRLVKPLAPTAQQSTQPWQQTQTKPAQVCQSVLNPDQRLARDQLTQFISLAPSTSLTTVHQAIAPPHCVLSKAGQSTQQEAYPLAFDPDTWFVVTYQDGAYQGYDFVFNK